LDVIKLSNNHQRLLWTINHLPHADAIIFIVNTEAAAMKSLSEAKRFFQAILKHDWINDKPVLIMLNGTHENENMMGREEVTRRLGMDTEMEESSRVGVYCVNGDKERVHKNAFHKAIKWIVDQLEG